MSTLIIAFIFIALGLLQLFWINKRKFQRRNVAGIEGFSSYGNSIVIRLLEKIGKWLAYAMILFGIISALAVSRDKRKKEKVEQSRTVFENAKIGDQ